MFKGIKAPTAASDSEVTDIVASMDRHSCSLDMIGNEYANHLEAMKASIDDDAEIHNDIASVEHLHAVVAEFGINPALVAYVNIDNTLRDICPAFESAIDSMHSTEVATEGLKDLIKKFKVILDERVDNESVDLTGLKRGAVQLDGQVRQVSQEWINYFQKAQFIAENTDVDLGEAIGAKDGMAIIKAGVGFSGLYARITTVNVPMKRADFKSYIDELNRILKPMNDLFKSSIDDRGNFSGGFTVAHLLKKGTAKEHGYVNAQVFKSLASELSKLAVQRKVTDQYGEFHLGLVKRIKATDDKEEARTLNRVLAVHNRIMFMGAIISMLRYPGLVIRMMSSAANKLFVDK